MADRFPLIVNEISKKIEELVSGDNLDLTGNGIVVSGDTGAGKYLYSDGSTVFWNTPGDVYLTLSQTLTNKTLADCTVSGDSNTIANIANTCRAPRLQSRYSRRTKRISRRIASKIM